MSAPTSSSNRPYFGMHAVVARTAITNETFLERLACGCTRTVRLRPYISGLWNEVWEVPRPTPFDPLRSLRPKSRKCSVHTDSGRPNAPVLDARGEQLRFAQRMARHLRARAKQRGLQYP
jgi:hypothetical protein